MKKVFEGKVDIFLFNGEPAYGDVVNYNEGVSLTEYLHLVLKDKKVRVTVEVLEDQ